MTDELEVAEEFNNFFVNKIEQLKNDINPSQIEDPLRRLKEKMSGLGTKLEFKTISQKKMTEHLKKLNKKKSSGLDGRVRKIYFSVQATFWVPLILL